MIDFFPAGRVFQSYGELPFAMKGRSKISINYKLFMGSLFKALKLSGKRNFKIFRIFYPQAGKIFIKTYIV